MRFQGTGFARLSLDTLQLLNVAVFNEPLIPRREFPCCDKNWGVLEVDGDLYIIYTVLPCLTVFKLDPAQKNGTTFIHASCLHDEAMQQLAAGTGLEMNDVRISGHPIWMAQYPRTLLVLVHHNWRKHGGSKHWVVQLQFDPRHTSFMVHAISRQPVLNHENYNLFNEHVQNVMAVGSYHLANGILRILYGEGDKYAAVADVVILEINWLYCENACAEHWTEGLSVSLGERIHSISHSQYKSMVW